MQKKFKKVLKTNDPIAKMTISVVLTVKITSGILTIYLTL